MDKRIKHFSGGNRSLILNDEISAVIELVCQHWNNEQEFEKNGMELRKGIFLGGGVGSGKTEIMKTYKDMKRHFTSQTILFASCQEANEAYMKPDTFSNNPKVQGFFALRHAVNPDNKSEFIFDDLGSEESYVNDYGNKVAIMPYIIDKREVHLFTMGRTHYTSNLSKPQILNNYGSRIESRLYKSVNFIGLGIKEDSINHRKQ